MNAQGIDSLRLYQKVELRDGRIGPYQGIHDWAKENNKPFIIVNVIPKDTDHPYGRDENFWPAQVKEGR